MDFNSMKDQVTSKAKDELLGKVDEVKQDISKKFGSFGGNKSVDPDAETQELASDPNLSQNPPSETAEPVEASDEQPETVEARGEEVDDASEDADKAEEEAA
jgi:hypothetical protein